MGLRVEAPEVVVFDFMHPQLIARADFLSFVSCRSLEGLVEVEKCLKAVCRVLGIGELRFLGHPGLVKHC